LAKAIFFPFNPIEPGINGLVVVVVVVVVVVSPIEGHAVCQLTNT